MAFWGPAVLATPGAGRSSDQAYAQLSSMLLAEGWTLLGENTASRAGWHAYVWQSPADNLLGDSFQLIIYRPVDTCKQRSKVQGLELEAVTGVEIGTLSAYRYNKMVSGYDNPNTNTYAPYRWSSSKVLPQFDLFPTSSHARGFLQTILGVEQWILVTKDQVYWGGGEVEQEGSRPLNVGFVGNMQPAAALTEYLTWKGFSRLPLLVNYGAGAHLAPWFYGLTDIASRGTRIFQSGKQPLKGFYDGFWPGALGRDKHEPESTKGATPINIEGALAAPEITQIIYYGSSYYGSGATGYVMETPQYIVPNLLQMYATPGDDGFRWARQGGIIDINASGFDAESVYPVSGRYMICEGPRLPAPTSMPNAVAITLVRTGPIPTGV